MLGLKYVCYFFHHRVKIYDKYVKATQGVGAFCWLMVAKDVLRPSWEGVVTRYLHMQESKGTSHLSHLAGKKKRH